MNVYFYSVSCLITEIDMCSWSLESTGTGLKIKIHWLLMWLLREKCQRQENTVTSYQWTSNVPVTNVQTVLKYTNQHAAHIDKHCMKKKMNVEVGVKLQLIVGYKLTTKIFLTVTTWCPNEKDNFKPWRTEECDFCHLIKIIPSFFNFSGNLSKLSYVLSAGWCQHE